MSTLLADYEAEQRAFEALFEPNCRERILLLHGESGSGKTTLLAHCLNRIPPSIPHIPIEMKETSVGVAEIFSRAGERLGWEHLSRFTDRVTALSGAPTVQIDQNRLMGINNRITVALHAESPVDREERRVTLTDAWFDDLRVFRGPVLLVLDVFEQAATEAREWISGPLLARAARVEQLRVVVAGQRVPEPKNIEWGHCCALHSLHGVPEAKHWLPIVEAMNRYIDAPDPLSWLAGICFLLKGRPSDVMQVIEGLPQREPMS